MKQFMTMIMTVVFGLSVTACADMNKQDVGTITGAAAGGVLGSTIGGGDGRLVAVGVGALVGALVGGAIGKSMDEQDRMKMGQALESNNVGQPAYWRNAKTGTSYKVTPTKNVKVGSNKYCREYQTTATIGGKQERMYGTACRQPDGSWKMVS